MTAVLYSVAEGIATLTLNRPESLNALNRAMIDDLRAATARAALDPAVRVVLLRGAGEHFMAGGDLKWFRAQLDQPAPAIEAQFDQMIAAVHASVLSLKGMNKPVIAVVRGAVAGFGLSLMLAADQIGRASCRGRV